MAPAGAAAPLNTPLYLLDTNSCIYLLAHASEPLTQQVESRLPGEIAISAIVYAELAVGLGQAGAQGRRTLDAFAETFPVMPFDTASALAYAAVPFRRGKLDRLIAAHALALDATLITNNEADFADVPGLKVENWTRVP